MGYRMDEIFCGADGIWYRLPEYIPNEGEEVMLTDGNNYSVGKLDRFGMILSLADPADSRFGNPTHWRPIA